MKGIVDEFGRALVSVEPRSNENGTPIEILAWVDTAFNGELPGKRYQNMNSKFSNSTVFYFLGATSMI